MIIGAEVALLLIGLYALITGRFQTTGGGKYIVQGWPARAIGAIGLLPVPLSLVVSTAVATLFIAQGRQVTPESFFWVGTAIEGSIVVACALAMFVLSRVFRTPVEAAQVPDSGRSFRAPLPTILDAIDRALHDLGAKSVKWSSDRRHASARLGASLWSWGERLTVEVDESGQVRVSSECASWQVVDWGKNAENRRKFLEGVAHHLESEVQA
jgi:hypothetical protein